MSSYRSDSRNNSGGSGGTHPGVKRESTWRPGASSSGSGAYRSTGAASASSSSSSRPTNAWATRDSPRVQSPGPSTTRVDSYYEPPDSSSSNRWGNSDDRDRNGHRGSSRDRDRDRSRDNDRRRDDGWGSRAKQQDKDTRGSWDDYRQRRAAVTKRASSPDRSSYRRRDDDTSGERRWGKPDADDRDRRDWRRASSPDERARRRSPTPPKAASRPSPDYGNRSESESDNERGRRPSRPSPRWRSPTPEPKRRAPSSPRAPEAKRAREYSPPSWSRRSSSPAPRGRSSSRSPSPPRRQQSVERQRSPSPARGARSGADRDRAPARSPSPGRGYAARPANRWPDRERWRPPARSQNNSTPARDRDLPVRDRDLPARDRDLPTRDRDLPVRDRDLPVRDRDLPVRDRDLPVRDRDLPARDRDVPAREPPREPRANRDWDQPKRSFENRRFSQENDGPAKMRQWGRGRSPSQSRSPSPAPAARRSQSPPPRRQQASQSARSRSPSPRGVRRRPSPSPTPPAQRVLSPPTGPRADRLGGGDDRRGGGFGWRRADAGAASTDRRDVGFPDRRSEPANRSEPSGTNGHPVGRPSPSSFPRARNASPTKGGWKSISARTAFAKNATPEAGRSNGAAARSHEDTPEVDMDVDVSPRKAAPQRSDKWSPIRPAAGELLRSGDYLSAMETKERQYDRHLNSIAPYIKAAFSQWYEQGTSPALKDFLVHYFGRSPSNDELDQVQQLLTLRTQLSHDQEELRHLHAQALRTEGQGQPPTGPAALRSQPSAGSTDTQVATRMSDPSTPSTAGVGPSLAFGLGRNTQVVPGEAYERLAQVGEGTYGKVYKARSNADGALVALKRIRMEQEKDGFPITSMREIKLLQALNHPNVVCLREMMVSKGSVYMVLEYMNHDLTGILSHPEVSLSPANIKSLNYQMLSGLGYLHRRGILHRDMKGSNILLNGAGELKLADFGLARFYHKHKRDDYTNRVITLWYRSPELLLGCIMLEIFTTKPVFQGTDEINQLDVIYSILGTPDDAQWPTISELPWYELMRPREAQASRFRAAFGKWLTPDALDLVEGLLAFDPAKRLLADAALRKPYFTTEAPAMEPPTQLAGCGEHHEMSVKLERHRRREGK